MTKKIYVLILLSLAITLKGLAQNGGVFSLNKLSKQDTLLSGWKFHPGDDPAWATASFDDSKWHSADPSQDITDFAELKNAGTGWLRLHVKMDSSLAKQQLTAWVLQYTASEIYLNGKLIRKYGTIAADPYKTKALCPSQELISLNLKPGADEVIAVRLGYQAGLPYISPFFTPLSAFNLYINAFPAAFDNYHANEQFITNGSIFIGSGAGLFLIICIIYLAYYMFDRRQRVNLYYLLFCISILLSLTSFVAFVGNIESLTAQMAMDVFVSFTFETGFPFMLLTIYILFDYKPRLIFKALIFIAVAFFICQFFKGTLGFILCSNVFSVLCFIEGSRVAAGAMKRKKNGALLLLCGMLLSIVFQIWSGLLNQATILSLVLAVISFAGFPLVMAIYLGIQHAVTNQQLRKTLVEVEELSQQKQQILADQNILLEEQVTVRTAELSQSLSELKSAQNQLVQKEKMASLGELTAGIAHEIQNPLNFVNNFSEVNQEMLEELKAESGKSKAERNEQLEIDLINDLIENEQKIRHHGKRADGIVKGMLEHSRTSTGQKEPIDLNKLADEYLRLAYQGLRAKDKNFDADLVTNFDEKLPRLNIVQQDIGRVLVNLFSNAFYAVNQKAKTIGSDYKAIVEVSTVQQNGSAIITVKDNGTGIPENIREKIMQPFFTTKPTGEGTGLGLSLTYDMVVKGHGGSIQVVSFEGEGSEFIINLPIS